MEEAEESARDLLRDALLAGQQIDHQAIEITDQAGAVHATIQLNLVVRRPRRHD